MTERGIAPDLDPLSCGWLFDPYPLLRRARSEEPVFYSSQRAVWVVTRYDDVLTVLKDPATFSSVDAVRGSAGALPDAVLQVLAEGIPDMPVLTASDPPLHTRLRHLVSRAFTPRRIALLEPRVRSIADGLLDEFAGEGSADIIGRFGWPLPLLVIGEMLGLPREELKPLHDWSRDWLLLLQGDPDLDLQVERARSVVSMQRYVASILEDRRRKPAEDLLSALFSADATSDAPLTGAEVAGVVFTLVVAGHLTVTRAIGSGLALVLADPMTRDALVRDPDLVSRTVEEILRMESPAQGLFRVTTRDVCLAGRRLAAGSRIMIHYGSANRDPDYFAEPETFDVNREDGDLHLAFGRGIHFCLGAALARLELGAAMPLLLGRLPNLRLDLARPPERDPIFFARGYTRLFVTWDVAWAASGDSA